jgi:ribonuclease J
LYEADDPEAERLTNDFASALEDLPTQLRRDDAALADAARAALRRVFGRRLQKRPLVDVHLLRVG